MAKQSNARTKRTTLDEVQGNETVPVSAGISNNDGQNQPAEAGQGQTAPTDPLKEFANYKAKLKTPTSKTWDAFRNALDRFEHDLIVLAPGEADEHGVRGGTYSQIRIVRAILPIQTVQPFHSGTFSGYGVERGEDFMVRLSNGKYVKGE